MRNNTTEGEEAKAVVRRNTEEVQGGGNYALFDELFADAFLDHTPQPNCTPDKAGALGLYKNLRAAFPDFHADIHWQRVDGDVVTTFKTYHGTHQGAIFGIAATGRKIHFETVDAMRVQDGKITEHWGVANLFSLLQQLGAWPPAHAQRTAAHMTNHLVSRAQGDALSLDVATPDEARAMLRLKGRDSVKF